MDLKNKTVALFGCEIRSVLVPVFVMLWVSSITSSTPVVLFTGEVDPSEYRFDGSGGVIDSKFVRLPDRR